jgi:hypothetical protein
MIEEEITITNKKTITTIEIEMIKIDNKEIPILNLYKLKKRKIN